MKRLLLDLKIFGFVTGQLLIVAILLFTIVGCDTIVGGTHREGRFAPIHGGSPSIVHAVSEPHTDTLLCIGFTILAVYVFARRK